MSKLTFKRLALVVVTALGAGVLASGPSSAAITNNSDTLTLSATTASIGTGETASVTITTSAIAGGAGESNTVNIITQSRPAGGNGSAGLYVTDSSNARILTSAWIPIGGNVIKTTAADGTREFDDYDSSSTSVTGNVSFGMGSRSVAMMDNTCTAGSRTCLEANIGSTAAKAMSGTFRFSFIAPTVAGTYVFRVYVTNNSSSTVQSVPQTFTVTVTANASAVGSATYSVAYLNRVAEFNDVSRLVSATDVHGKKGLEADSALVVSAGSTTNSSNSPIAIWTPIVKNSSDTKVATLSTADGAVNNTRVKDSITVTMTGPGLLAVSSYWTGNSATTTRAKQVTINWNESVVVYADGTAGTGTITGYVGTTLTSPYKFAQATKSITFVGRATTFTVTGYTANIRAGSNVAYIKDDGTSDSDVAGSQAIRFKAYDAVGNEVTDAGLSVDQGQGAFWAMSSDTSVLAATPIGAGSAAAISAARKTPYLPCSYNSTTGTSTTSLGYWTCTGAVYDSGTVTLTIVDSRTVTPNGANYLVNATGGVYRSSPFSVTYVANGYTGTIALDKSLYNTNEKALLTLTCVDIMGRTVAFGHNTCFSNLNWVGLAPTFASDASTAAAGGTFTSLSTYLTSGTTFVAGSDTAMVYMPSTYTGAGVFELKGRTGSATSDSTLLKWTVTDPVQVAQGKAIADAQAAADAATDAALQAIDAANAATDAANLSAEAADAATVAAEEAKDAADAATAAVEALATQVATLMAALQAQIRSLANTVAKIAKKVKA
jgi:hypothetical protein